LAFLTAPLLLGLAQRYAHAAFPLAQLGASFEWVANRPAFTSLLVTLFGVWLFARHSWSSALPRDSIIGAAYVTAYGLTLLFILRSPKGMEDVRELLDGSVLAAAASDLVVMAIVFGFVLLTQLLFYKQYLYVSFDAEAAAAQTYNVAGWELLFYVTLGIAITVAIRHAGILLVFAHFVIPPITGLVAAYRMGRVLTVAIVSAVISATLGFVLALRWDMPLSPPTIGVGLAILAIVSILRRRATV